MSANSFLNIPKTTPQPFSIGALLGGLGGALGNQAATPRGPSQAQSQTSPTPTDPATFLKSLLGGAQAGAVMDPNLAAILHAYRPDPHDVRSWQDRSGAWGSSNFTPQGQWDAQNKQRQPQPMQPVVGNFLAGAMGGASGGY